MAFINHRTSKDYKHVRRLILRGDCPFRWMPVTAPEWRMAYRTKVVPSKMFPRQKARLERTNYDLLEQQSIASRILLRSNIHEVIAGWQLEPAYVYTRRMLDEIYREYPELEQGIDAVEQSIKLPGYGRFKTILYCFPYKEAGHENVPVEEALRRILHEETDYLTLAHGLNHTAHKQLLAECYRAIARAYPAYREQATAKALELK